MLPITFQKCLWNLFQNRLRSWIMSFPWNQTHHSDWDLVCDPRQHFPAWLPNLLHRHDSEWLRTVSKTQVSPLRTLLSELSFYNTSQIMCFSGSWLYRELSLNFSARFSKLSTIYTPHPAFQFHHPKTHMFSLLTGDGYRLLSLYHVHNTVLRALHNTPFYLYMIL